MATRWPGEPEGKTGGKGEHAGSRETREKLRTGVHICPLPLWEPEEPPTTPGGARCPAQEPGCSSAGTLHRRAPLHGPIFHCQGPAAAQFITAKFGNYPCKHGVIPPGKGLIAHTAWASSAKTAGIWAVSGLTPETQGQ